MGVGLLHGSRMWSYEQRLMDCETFDIVHKMIQGIVVDDDTLALDAIRSVGSGPDGNFLALKHTETHMGDIWLPQFMDRRPYEIWEEKRDGVRDGEREKATHILTTRRPHPLNPKLSEELQRIIASVEGE